MRGKLIVIEGTDCSGKETQSNLLIDFLNSKGIKTKKFSFPNYASPTGKIIAGPYLGKAGYYPPLFKEGASNVDPYCASLLYAMDRKYNISIIENELAEGVNVVLDRYVDSNMAHQGSKLEGDKREQMFTFLERLEYELLGLPHADLQVLLHMPTWAGVKLRQRRIESADQHESDEEHLKRAEAVYLDLAKRSGALIIECAEENSIYSIEQISQKLCMAVYDWLKKKRIYKSITKYCSIKK